MLYTYAWDTQITMKKAIKKSIQFRGELSSMAQDQLLILQAAIAWVTEQMNEGVCTVTWRWVGLWLTGMSCANRMGNQLCICSAIVE